jgi:hypothetical protein
LCCWQNNTYNNLKMTNASLLIVPDRFKASKLYSQLPQDGSGDFVVTRATTSFRTNENGILESVASGVPRLDFPIGSGCPALLVEPAATNLILRSEEFNDASWGKSGGVTITANFDTAPNGLTTADRWVSLGGSFPQISQAITVVSGTTYTASLYVKSDGTAQIAQRILIGGTGVNFTPNNTWQRITVSFTAASTSVNFVIATNSPVAPASSFVIWGAQLETGSVATSYIPTVAATATRNADVINKTAVSGLIGQTAGCIYAEWEHRAEARDRRILTIRSDNSNFIALTTFSSNQVSAAIIVASASTIGASLASSALSIGIHKVALAYDLNTNGVAFYLDGALVGTTRTATALPSMSEIGLGILGTTGANILGSGIRAAALYTTRLSNAQLQFLTTL